MREIKFRGKSIAEVTGVDFDFKVAQGDWVYGAYVHNNGRPYIISHDVADVCEEYFAPEYWCMVDPATVGQYIGLKDKNGVEIYEGDVFKAPHDFGPGGFSVRRAVVRWHNIFGYQWQYWHLSQLEIIGNIHDNPELLEGACE